MRMVTVMCQYQLLLVTATLVGGNCRFQWVVTVASNWQENAIIGLKYSKTAFVIVYMILMTMRPDFYFNYFIIQYRSKGDVIYYEGLLY